MNKTTKIKLFTSLAVLLLNCICTACVFLIPIESTFLKIAGSFVSIILVSVAVWVFPTKFYVTTLIFVFLASSLGSCLNLYRHVEFYDLFVHFLSGVLIFYGGGVIIEYINNKRGHKHDILTVGLFSLFFSCSCAAFWEIFEYLCDILISADMQGTKANTMNDIIAGVLGAVIGYIALLLIEKIKVKK